MRGLFRLLVVGFTVVSLMLVGVVGVSATSTSGKAESAKAFNSAVALFSGHSDQTGTHDGTGTTDTKNGKDKEKDKDHDKGDHQCKPPKHKNGTPGHEHHDCGDPDHDSD
jgi:hypothetical protein